MFIAVVGKTFTQDMPTGRQCVTALNKDDVIKKAIYLRQQWEAKGNGPYRILVGELTSEVQIHPQWTEVPFQAVPGLMTNFTGSE